MTKDKTVTMSRELLPCPFCGCEVQEIRGFDYIRVYGTHGTDCPFLGDDPLIAEAKEWNTRAAPIVEADGMGEAVALSIPDECPHLIMFDDTERENLLFSGAGARSAALMTWEKISMSWNAHLFVRVERNSRDDRHPSARASQPAPVSVVLPERLTSAELEELEVIEALLHGQGLSNLAGTMAAARQFIDEIACLDKVKELNQ